MHSPSKLRAYRCHALGASAAEVSNAENSYPNCYEQVRLRRPTEGRYNNTIKMIYVVLDCCSSALCVASSAMSSFPDLRAHALRYSAPLHPGLAAAPFDVPTCFHSSSGSLPLPLLKNFYGGRRHPSHNLKCCSYLSVLQLTFI
jgi:hypothetical protein